MKIPGLEISWFHLDLGTAKYDLNVWLKIKEAIEVAFEYNSDLFEPGSMRRMLESYRTILESVVADPDAPRRIEVAEIKSSEATEEFVGPRNPLEVQSVELWEDALQVRPIGIRQNLINPSSALFQKRLLGVACRSHTPWKMLRSI